MNQTRGPLPGPDDQAAQAEETAWVSRLLAAEPLPSMPSATTRRVLAALALEQQVREGGGFNPDAGPEELEDELDVDLADEPGEVPELPLPRRQHRSLELED